MSRIKRYWKLPCAGSSGQWAIEIRHLDTKYPGMWSLDTLEPVINYPCILYPVPNHRGICYQDINYLATKSLVTAYWSIPIQNSSIRTIGQQNIPLQNIRLQVPRIQNIFGWSSKYLQIQKIPDPFRLSGITPAKSIKPKANSWRFPGSDHCKPCSNGGRRITGII